MALSESIFVTNKAVSETYTRDLTHKKERDCNAARKKEAKVKGLS